MVIQMVIMLTALHSEKQMKGNIFLTFTSTINEELSLEIENRKFWRTP